MHRVFGSVRSRTGRLGLVAGVALATVVALAVPAGANTGHVVTAQTCYTWSASVTLDNNVHSANYVEVTTTIPGTTGIVDGHYNTTGNSGTTQIWSTTGTAPSSGTVTLTILNPDRSLDSRTSASLPPAPVCPTTTMAPTTTIPPTTTDVTVTTAGATTTIEVSPTTVMSPPSTVHGQGSTLPTTTTTPTVVVGSLPRTGSGTLFPAVFGLCCVAGGALLALNRRRRAWTRA